MPQPLSGREVAVVAVAVILLFVMLRVDDRRVTRAEDTAKIAQQLADSMRKERDAAVQVSVRAVASAKSAQATALAAAVPHVAAMAATDSAGAREHAARDSALAAAADSAATVPVLEARIVALVRSDSAAEVAIKAERVRAADRIMKLELAVDSTQAAVSSLQSALDKSNAYAASLERQVAALKDLQPGILRRAIGGASSLGAGLVCGGGAWVLGPLPAAGAAIGCAALAPVFFSP